MRILLSCLQDLRPHPIPAYRFWGDYFKRGIAEAGQEWGEICDIDWAEGCMYDSNDRLQEWRDKTWSQTLKWIHSQHSTGRPIHLFLSYLFPQQIDPGAISDIKQLGIPCVNFFCDNVREFTRVPSEFHCFDLHWVPEAEALPMYSKAGLPYINAPMPCWVPPSLRRVPSSETEPATFLGSADELRRELIVYAVAAGADIVVRGPGWDEIHQTSWERPRSSIGEKLINQWRFLRGNGVADLVRKINARLRTPPNPSLLRDRVKSTVFGDEYFRVTREAVVTLGISRVPTFRADHRQPLRYSRLRDIEAPMLGACYLTEHTAGIGDLYQVGAEIEAYTTAEELAQKLQMLKNDPERRRMMRESAQRRALADHTVANSIRRIITRLGLT